MASLGDWIVTFEFNRLPQRRQTPLESQWAFEEIKDGFWLNADHQICRQGQGHYWVPPSRIMLIEPLEKQM
jgi:hypothetical protein